jgi:hypothetical protein
VEEEYVVSVEEKHVVSVEEYLLQGQARNYTDVDAKNLF